MSLIIPKSRPQLTKAEAEKIVKHKLGAALPSLTIIGVRGYYSKSMGPTAGNDINIYDDAVILFGLDTFVTFNGNTDPSFVKKNGRELAKLNEGVYKFYKGKHRGKYNALRSYPEGVVLDCTRSGLPAKCSHINIHKGGTSNGSAGVTWSEGCITIPAPQYAEFIETVYLKMLKNNMKTVTFILLTAEDMEKIIKA